MAMNTAKGRFFVIVGPGGAGKDTLMQRALSRLAETQVYPLVTATTRPPRPGEDDAVAYHFRTHEQFRQMIDRGELLEYQQVTSGNYYGIPRASVDLHVKHGQHVMADIDIYGAMHVRQTYPGAVLIFVSVGTPDMTDEQRLDILRQRMETRGDAAEGIRERLERARALELGFAARCDVIIYNNDLAQAVDDLVAAVQHAIQQPCAEGADA